MVTPRFSAKGRSVSVASSAMSDRSTCSRAKDRWSARLSRSSASVRSIARVLTAWRRSTSSSSPRLRIVAGDVEQCLRDRQRGAQLVGGVGCESLLFGDVCFEPREHGVEGVGEFAELVIAARQPDSVGERSGRSRACGVGDAGQGGEHAAGEKPPSHETEHQQERQHRGRPRSEDVQEVGPDGKDTGMRGVGVDEERTVGDVTQEEQPHGAEQQGAGEHEEAGVAEGEFEANAQTGGSIHGLLPRARCPIACRCGSRRRARWR